MLVLARQEKQRIQIGPDITVTVVRIEGKWVKIGIDAPREVRIVRRDRDGLGARVAFRVSRHCHHQPLGLLAPFNAYACPWNGGSHLKNVRRFAVAPSQVYDLLEFLRNRLLEEPIPGSLRFSLHAYPRVRSIYWPRRVEQCQLF